MPATSLTGGRAEGAAGPQAADGSGAPAGAVVDEPGPGAPAQAVPTQTARYDSQVPASNTNAQPPAAR